MIATTKRNHVNVHIALPGRNWYAIDITNVLRINNAPCLIARTNLPLSVATNCNHLFWCMVLFRVPTVHSFFFWSRRKVQSIGNPIYPSPNQYEIWHFKWNVPTVTIHGDASSVCTHSFCVYIVHVAVWYYYYPLLACLHLFRTPPTPSPNKTKQG